MKLVHNYIKVTKQINDLSALSVNENCTLKQEEKALKEQLNFLSTTTLLFLTCILSFYLPVFYFFPEVDSVKSVIFIINHTKACLLGLIPFFLVFVLGVFWEIHETKKRKEFISSVDFGLILAISALVAFFVIFNILGFAFFIFIFIKTIFTFIKYQSFMKSVPKIYLDSEQRVTDLKNKQKRIFNAILEDKDSLNILSNPNHKINELDKKLVQSLRKSVLKEKLKTVQDTELLTYITNAQTNQILND